VVRVAVVDPSSSAVTTTACPASPVWSSSAGVLSATDAVAGVVVVGGLGASVAGGASPVEGAPVVDVEVVAATVDVEPTVADLTSDGAVDPQAARSSPTTTASQRPMTRERTTATPLP
jgi:hypothetical protein